MLVLEILLVAGRFGKRLKEVFKKICRRFCWPGVQFHG